MDPGLNAAQQSAIDGAVATLNAALGVYGVNLVEVPSSQAASANYVLHLDTTSVLGGTQITGITTFRRADAFAGFELPDRIAVTVVG